MGLAVQELTGELAERYGYEDLKGVIITSVDPESPVAGVDNPPQRGDLIDEIELQEIKNMDDYRKVIEKIGDEDDAMIRLTRPGHTSWYVLAKK